MHQLKKAFNKFRISEFVKKAINEVDFMSTVEQNRQENE